MKIFYHIDNDGNCAAACVKQYYKEMEMDIDVESIEYFPINYGMEFPFDEIEKDELVYIVDFSIEVEDMTKLLDITENVIWIDHHISAIKKYDCYEREIEGLRYDGIAGCMLTYCYLFCMNHGEIPFDTDMTKTAPRFVKYIADRDVWTFEYGDDTNNFHSGFYMKDSEPDEEIWMTLFADEGKETDEIITNGKLIHEYKSKYYSDYAKAKGFPTVLDEYRVYAVNLSPGFADSSVFDEIDSNEYDIFAIFATNGKRYTYTLYSETVDVSVVASNHGGGGHKGAAGFRSDGLIFKHENDIMQEDGAKIICVHDCCGTSSAARRLEESGYRVLEVNYENFSKKLCAFTTPYNTYTKWSVPIQCEMANEYFPTNFINYINERKEQVDYIFVSSNEEVREALFLANINYYLIYPDRESKDTIIRRAKSLKYSSDEISKMNRSWDGTIESFEKDKAIKKFVLNEKQFVSDILDCL